jgi:Holliday junction resolvase RusA-like endonuclease
MKAGVEYPIKPVPKPRMTRRDKWSKRDCVMRYRAFKDMVRLHRVKVPESGSHIIFRIEMPRSWSEKKKKAMDGQPHQQTPDVDNLLKALLDAIYKNDSHIWDSRVTKLWARRGSIEIRGRCSLETETEKLAAAHWDFVGGLLETVTARRPVGGYSYDVVEYIFKTAFVHGFKHGVESAEVTRKG